MKQALVIGSGGREHALAWALSRSPLVQHVFVAPGNGGTTWAHNPAATALQPHASASNVPIDATNIAALVQFAQDHQIDMTVVGPEASLAVGIVDAFQQAGLPIFGPTQAAAQLEISKTVAKQLMHELAIPTAAYQVFTDYDAACAYVERNADTPLVIKADGLAAGKGVSVCADKQEALDALRRMMAEREFGAAGERVIVEERLVGREVSVLAFSDGKTVALMPAARDHKPAYDGDQGPNTGGMGAYTHPPDVTPDMLATIERTVLQPVVAGMAARGTPYVGVLYAGLILTAQGFRVLEFNCRFGDPEIEAILPLLETDLLEIVTACVTGTLHQCAVTCRAGVGATVVLASPGYPGTYPKELPISGIETVASWDNVIVFHAGTTHHNGQIVTAGGRVLAVSAIGNTLPATLRRAYHAIDTIQFDGMHYRHDIGGGLG